MLGPRRLIGPVLAQIEVLDGLRRGVRPPYADPLLRLLAQYGEMVWLSQDSGDLGAAAHWSRRAAEWAQCAGDTQMAAYMLIRQSNIATLTDDHAAVVQFAAAARRAPGPTEPKLSWTASSLARDRGHLTAKLAVAITQASQPDPSRAAHLGMDALAIARDTGSARIIRELRTLGSQLLARWPERPESQSLSEALAVA